MVIPRPDLKSPLSSTFPIEGLYKGRKVATYEESSSTKKRFFK